MSLLNQLKWIRVLPFKHYYKVKRIELEYDKLHLRWKLCKNYNLNCRYFTLKFPQPNTASKENFLWNNLAKHVTKTLRTTYGSVSAGREKWANFVLKKYFLTLHCDQTVQLFQLFSTVLKRFCPVQSKNSLVLVQAHFLTWQFSPILPRNCDFWQFFRSI